MTATSPTLPAALNQNHPKTQADWQQITNQLSTWQQGLATLLPPYQQTAAEQAAGVTPINFGYPPGTIERYYRGSGDARAAIQSALNSNTIVYSFYGWQTAYPVSNYLTVPAGVILQDCSLACTASPTTYANWGSAHQGQLVLLNGDNAQAVHLQINCANFAAGGVGLYTFAYNVVTHCTIFNGTQQGVLMSYSQMARISANTFYYLLAGVQHYQTTHCSITDNVGRVFIASCYWGTDSWGLTCIGNAGSDCGDVGLDIEGGVDCIVSGNSVNSCANGELTWFSGGASPWNIVGITQATDAIVTMQIGTTLCPIGIGHQLTFVGVGGMTAINGLTGTVTAVGGSSPNWLITVNINSSGFGAYTSGGTFWRVPMNCYFVGNVAWHTFNYLAWNGTAEVIGPNSALNYGGITINSLAQGQRGIVFCGNVVRCDCASGIWSTDTAAFEFDCGICITDNAFYCSSVLHFCATLYNIVVKNNLFHGLAGAELTTSYFKNVSAALIDNNNYVFDNASTTAVVDIQVTQTGQGSFTFSNNKFKNTGPFALKIDAAASTSTGYLFGNLLSEGFVSNGGLVVTSTLGTGPYFRGQKLFVAVPPSAAGATTSLDLSTIQALQFNQTVCDGKLLCVGGNSMGASYSFVYSASGPTLISRDGSGSGTGIPTSTSRYATFSGTVMTIASIASTVVQGSVELDCVSWQ